MQKSNIEIGQELFNTMNSKWNEFLVAQENIANDGSLFLSLSNVKHSTSYRDWQIASNHFHTYLSKFH